MPHFDVLDAEPRQRRRGGVADRGDALDRKEPQQRFDEALADGQLARGRQAVRERIAVGVRMKRERVPEQRQRLDMPDRRQDHRRTRLRRRLRPRRRAAESVAFAEDVADGAEHQRLAHERDAGEPPAAIADRFADEHQPRLDGIELLEVASQVAPADRVRRLAARVLVAGGRRERDAGELVDEAVEAARHAKILSGMALVTIMTFNRVHEAELARTALEAEGIPAVVLDRFTGDRFFENAPRGIRLQVNEEDAEAADAVLNRTAGLGDAEYVTPSDELPWQPPDACPNCGAPDR